MDIVGKLRLINVLADEDALSVLKKNSKKPNDCYSDIFTNFKTTLTLQKEKITHVSLTTC